MLYSWQSQEVYCIYTTTGTCCALQLTVSGSILYIYNNWNVLCFRVDSLRKYTVYIQQLVRVVLYSWLSVGRVEIQPYPANRQSTEKQNTYQLLYMYSMLPDDELQICPKHVEVDWRNKQRINSAASWFLLQGYIEMHGQQNTKKVFNFSKLL